MRGCVDVRATSERLGWTSAYASIQQEQPFEASLSRTDDCLVILHRNGPVPVNLRVGGDRQLTQRRRRGQVSFIPGACDGYVNLLAPHDTLHIYLRSQLFGHRAEAFPPLLGIEDPILENLAGAIGEALIDGLPRSSLYVDPMAQAVATRVLDIAGHAPKRRHIHRLSDRQLNRFREFVEAHLENDIRLEDLAAACGVSTKFLKQSFQASSGTTPYRYVQNQRVKRAKELLADTTLSLSEIALRSGFCHQEHLTRVFSAATGQPPGQYRSALSIKSSGGWLHQTTEPSLHAKTTVRALEPGPTDLERLPLTIPAETSSGPLCLLSASASVQREGPGSARIESGPRHLLISSSSGPGDVSYRIDGQNVRRHVQARGLFFLPAGHVCDVTLHNIVHSIHLHLDPGLFNDPEFDGGNARSGLAPMLDGDDSLLQGLLGVMEELVRGDRTESVPLIAGLIGNAIARRLVAIHRQIPKTLPADPALRLSGGHLRKVREFIEANLAGEIRLQSLADLCGVGVAHFMRLFKSTTGVPPYQYVLGLRIGRAKALLSDAAAVSLTDVARSCGFSNQQHLARTFRRVAGVTPGRFRELRRREQNA